MKFTTNTKPLITALDLGIIDSNISNFHMKSNIVQITATKNTLTINLEASRICTQLSLKGSGDSDTTAVIFVSSTLFKKLMATIESASVTLEFSDAGLIIHSNSSKFTLPKMIDAGELELDKPTLPEYNANVITIDQADWKFIKDNQMYAIAMSFVKPVYTKVWIGENGDVLVCDYQNSMFTHSKHSKLGTTCLLSDTVINLFINLPEGAKLSRKDTDYLISYSSDSFDYITQFTPFYETDEGVGSYNSDIFLSMLTHPENFITVNVEAVCKLLKQSQLLGNSIEDVITWSVEDNNIVRLKDNNIDGKITVSDHNCSNYSVEFKTNMLLDVISHYSSETVKIGPIIQEDEVGGIIVWSDELTSAVAGVI